MDDHEFASFVYLNSFSLFENLFCIFVSWILVHITYYAWMKRMFWRLCNFVIGLDFGSFFAALFSLNTLLRLRWCWWWWLYKISMVQMMMVYRCGKCGGDGLEEDCCDCNSDDDCDRVVDGDCDGHGVWYRWLWLW